MWLAYAVAASSVAVGVAAATARVVPRREDKELLRVVKYACALANSSLVLPIAAVWDDSINEVIADYWPKWQGMSSHVILSVKALVIHVGLCSTLQLALNRSRGSAPSSAIVERRHVFENKTLMYVVAWGWWNVPLAVFATPSFTRAHKMLALVVVVVLYFSAALLKTLFQVAKPEQVQSFFAMVFSMWCASCDPQLGWAIVALYINSVYDRATNRAAIFSVLW